MENSSQHDHQHSNQINQEATSRIQDQWDKQSEHYDKTSINITYQIYAMLCVHTQVQNRSRILDIACGSGTHTLYLAKSMLKEGGAIVCTDISKKMIEIAKDKFNDEKHGVNNQNGCVAHVNLDEVDGQSRIDLEQEIQKYTNSESEKKLVYGLVANNECLPFQDQSFDCYISNLSLMLVDNYKNQLSEAFRVTKSGGVVGFSVIGRQENCKMTTILGELGQKYELIPPGQKTIATVFQLGKDLVWLKKEFESYGFTEVRVWYQPLQFIFETFDDFYKFFQRNIFGMNPQAKGEDVFKNFMADLEKHYNEYLSSDVVDFRSNEVAMVIAKRA